MIFLKKYFSNSYIHLINKANRNLEIFCFKIMDVIYLYENYYVFTFFINKVKNLR
jgi:hypothetical protein